MKTVSKAELATIVVDSIRQRSGCENVESVVIQASERPMPRWEIAVITASRGDFIAVQSAAVEVQRTFQTQYQIG